MKWWQQLTIQVLCVMSQGLASHYLPADLKDTVIVSVAMVQAAVAHKASVSDPNSGENIKGNKNATPNT